MIDKFLKSTILMSMLLFSQIATAQFILTEENNKPLIGDKIERNEVTGLYCDGYGENVIWDFTDCDVLENVFPLRFSFDSLAFKSLESGLRKSYRQVGDSLQVYAYRSNVESVNYTRPQLVLSYPFGFGDSISSSFEGKGTFGDIYDLSQYGTKTIVADAQGSILLPNNRALTNILRVHSITFRNVLLEGLAPNLIDSAKVKQEVEDEYFWYVKGCRYPVFEYHIGTSYSDGNQIASLIKAYGYLPDSVMSKTVSASEIVWESDRKPQSDKELIDATIFPIDYKISQTGNVLKLSFTSFVITTVTFVIASTMGVIYQNKTLHCGCGDIGELIFECNGYQSGSYILYVNVNGKVKSEKFQIK